LANYIISGYGRLFIELFVGKNDELKDPGRTYRDQPNSRFHGRDIFREIGHRS